jgi:predicted O-methyltransferase YrrM
MSAQKPASWAYAEEFVTEDEVVEQARRRGEELGAVPVGNGAGVLLRLLAAAAKARSVVEIGTGAGTSGLWLLQGMPDDGILTTIDVETEHQGAAKKA